MNIMPKRMLRYAIAGSLTVHIIVAHFVQPPSVSAATEPPPARLVVMRIKPPVKKPLPTPQPKPQTHVAVHSVMHAPELQYHTTTKGAQSQPRVAVAPPGPPGGNGPGPDYPITQPGTPAPAETPEPVIPTPSCTEPDVAAHVVNAITPDTPELARQEGLNGVTEVRVDLRPDGTVDSVSVYRSSGSTLLDGAALRAAKASTYAAASHDCRNLSGSYIFKAEFDN